MTRPGALVDERVKQNLRCFAAFVPVFALADAEIESIESALDRRSHHLLQQQSSRRHIGRSRDRGHGRGPGRIAHSRPEGAEHGDRPLARIEGVQLDRRAPAGEAPSPAGRRKACAAALS